MDYVLNESEQAKQELMHYGMRGMRWGVRKADTRLALSLRDGGKGSRVPGAKAVRSANKVKNEKAMTRFNEHIKSVRQMDKSYDALKKQRMSEIDKGPGNRLSKALAKYSENFKIENARGVGLGKREESYVKGEQARNSRVKAKQDKLANELKSKMDAEIKEARSKGNIVEKIFNPMTIEMKYTQQLVEGLARIDKEED